MATATPTLSNLSAGGDIEEPHHNRDFALQKYHLLQEQHESLREHLRQLRPLGGSPPSTYTSPTTSPVRANYDSVQTSPYHSRSSSVSMPQSRTRSNSRRASLPTPTKLQHSRSRSGSADDGLGLGFTLEAVMDEAVVHEVAVEEARLFDVNEGIKRTLTELLNCQAVRADSSFRTWVQSRLMDTERELRQKRRRRSYPVE